MQVEFSSNNVNLMVEVDSDILSTIVHDNPNITFTLNRTEKDFIPPVTATFTESYTENEVIFFGKPNVDDLKHSYDFCKPVAKIKAIKAIRDATQMGLTEAKLCSENPVAQSLGYVSDAEALANDLREFGYVAYAIKG